MTMFFDPFREANRLTAALLGNRAGVGGMPVDLYREGDHYVMNADLPGVQPDSIDVSVDGQTLTVRAERVGSANEDVEWLAAERPRATYVRQFSVSDGIDAEHIDASYENGVLTVVVPVADRATSRKIPVTAGRTGTTSIEAGGSAAQHEERQEVPADQKVGV